MLKLAIIYTSAMYLLMSPALSFSDQLELTNGDVIQGNLSLIHI